MIYKIDITKNNHLYGLYEIDKPYPKNTFLKKSTNKRLFHVVESITHHTKLDHESAVFNFFNR